MNKVLNWITTSAKAILAGALAALASEGQGGDLVQTLAWALASGVVTWAMPNFELRRRSTDDAEA